MNKLLDLGLAGVGAASVMAGCPYGVVLVVAVGVARSLRRAARVPRPMRLAI